MDATDPRAVLDQLVMASGVSYAALSRMIRRNDAYLQQYVKRGTPRILGERDRRLLAAFFRVDEAVLGGPAASPAAIPVRRLDLAASAGPGGLAEDDRRLRDSWLDPAILASLGVGPDAAAMLPARGESMLPTIQDGDMMLVDESDRRPGRRDAIFVIRLDGALMVKRVALVDGALAITSDNPDFPAIPLRRPAEVDVVGRVVWLSRALR
jgi:phage repressor protein C with HTH and peptisase S24 domain